MIFIRFYSFCLINLAAFYAIDTDIAFNCVLEISNRNFLNSLFIAILAVIYEIKAEIAPPTKPIKAALISLDT